MNERVCAALCVCLRVCGSDGMELSGKLLLKLDSLGNRMELLPYFQLHIVFSCCFIFSSSPILGTHSNIYIFRTRVSVFY